jgi:hypothetical protein
MNKFSKILLLAIVFAAPIAAPAVQANTIAPANTKTFAAKPTGVKSVKVTHHQHSLRHHHHHTQQKANK